MTALVLFCAAQSLACSDPTRAGAVRCRWHLTCSIPHAPLHELSTVLGGPSRGLLVEDVDESQEREEDQVQARTDQRRMRRVDVRHMPEPPASAGRKVGGAGGNTGPRCRCSPPAVPPVLARLAARTA